MVGSNGASILAFVASLCNIEAFKILMDNHFKYINLCHISVAKILRRNDLEKEYKIRLLKIDGLSALDIFNHGMEYKSIYVTELLQLKDLQVDFIFPILRDVGEKISIENLELALNHLNLSVDVAVDAFYELLSKYTVTDGTNSSVYYHNKSFFQIIQMIYEKFRDEIRGNFSRFKTIRRIIMEVKNMMVFKTRFSSEFSKDEYLSMYFDNFQFIIKEKLFCYDQLIRCFRDLVNLFIKPKRIEYLLSVVKDDDFEACALMSLDEVMKRIERGKIDDISKYFFMFCFKNVCYDKMSIISRIVLLSNIKISVYLLSFISTSTDIDPNYFDFNRSENPPLHLAIIRNNVVAALQLISFRNVNLRLKNRSGLTPLALCKLNNHRELYSIIVFVLRRNKELFSLTTDRLINQFEEESELLSIIKQIKENISSKMTTTIK